MRIPLLLAIVLTTTAVSSASHADEPHRLAVGGYFGFGANFADVDGHWSDGNNNVGGRLGYEYAVTRWLSVGATAAYLFNTTAKAAHAVSARAHVRLHVPLTTSLDLGLTLEGGGLGVVARDVRTADGRSSDTRLFRGYVVGGGPDLRIALGKGLSMDIAPEIFVGQANDPGPNNLSYFRQDCQVLGLGLWLGVGQSF